MAMHVPNDVLEQILVALDVKDLIRYKSVCKSWQSLISDFRFVKSHLNNSYNKDVINNNIGHRRIIMGWLPFGVTPAQFKHDSYLLGSSNGLVCMSTPAAKILVANPLTREMKTLQKTDIPVFWSLCFGFGYDSSTDDYKVIIGFQKSGNRICFQVLALKSNVWKDIGEVKYSFITKVGVLCNDALHWFMKDQNKKKVILSFGLAGEEFKEVPQPNDAIYRGFGIKNMTLGITGGCLCVYDHTLHPRCMLWIMKKYNVKHSWKTGYDYGIKFDIFHFLRRVDKHMLNERSFCDDHIIHSRSILSAPIYVKSLVSPP